MSSTVTIAIDAMGGDHGPVVTANAALRFLSDTPDARVLLFGREAELGAALKWARGEALQRVELRFASEVVEMHEPPANALRGKKDSSMRLAINAVRDGEAQACVSAGNTGALMAISRFVLKTLPGVERPAIASSLPTQTGVTTVLDLGANVNCTADHLLQFAAMGSALVSAVHGVERPTIGLLNIGEEEIKGNDVVKEAAERLKQSGLNFYGNVEGDDIYKGTTDVVVCDGFVGNVALKTSEGLARMLGDFLRDELVKNPVRKALVVFALPAIHAFKRRIDPRHYNGATLVGLKGVVVKSHGGADMYGFRRALYKAYAEVVNNVLERIAQRLPVIASAALAHAATSSDASQPEASQPPSCASSPSSSPSSSLPSSRSAPMAPAAGLAANPPDA